jgi:hypothetical protein
VSWLDILNGYQFKYAKLDVHPLQRDRAQQALQAISSSPRQSIDPRICVPAAQDPQQARG